MNYTVGGTINPIEYNVRGWYMVGTIDPRMQCPGGGGGGGGGEGTVYLCIGCRRDNVSYRIGCPGTKKWGTIINCHTDHFKTPCKVGPPRPYLSNTRTSDLTAILSPWVCGM